MVVLRHFGSRTGHRGRLPRHFPGGRGGVVAEGATIIANLNSFLLGTIYRVSSPKLRKYLIELVYATTQGTWNRNLHIAYFPRPPTTCHRRQEPSSGNRLS